MLTAAQRKFLAREQVLAPALFNLVLNAGAGWLLFRESVPLFGALDIRSPRFGEPNLAGDIVGMAFFLPFLTCLAVTPLVRRAARDGKVAPLSIRADQHPWLRRLPHSTWRRGALVGIVCALALTPASLGLLLLLGVRALPLDAAVMFKGLFAAVLAALVTPLFALYALAGTRPDPSRD